jgi:hypothetical protein
VTSKKRLTAAYLLARRRLSRERIRPERATAVLPLALAGLARQPQSAAAGKIDPPADGHMTHFLSLTYI